MKRQVALLGGGGELLLMVHEMMDGSFIAGASMPIVSFSIRFRLVRPGSVVVSMSARVCCLWFREALHPLMSSSSSPGWGLPGRLMNVTATLRPEPPLARSSHLAND